MTMMTLFSMCAYTYFAYIREPILLWVGWVRARVDDFLHFPLAFFRLCSRQTDGPGHFCNTALVNCKPVVGWAGGHRSSM
jgi:hypothetical protein